MANACLKDDSQIHKICFLSSFISVAALFYRWIYRWLAHIRKALYNWCNLRNNAGSSFT